MTYIHIDIEDLLGKSFTDCVKYPRIFIPLILGTVFSVIASGIMAYMIETGSVSVNFIFPIVVLVLLSIVVQLWFYEEAKDATGHKKESVTEALYRTLMLLPRFLGASIVYVLMIVAVITVFGLCIALASVLPSFVSILWMVFVFLLMAVALFYVIISSIYFAPIIFLEKSPWYRCGIDAFIYASNKKLESFVIMVIMILMVGISMVPQIIFTFFQEQTYQIYFNPIYYVVSIPVLLVSAYSGVIMFNLYLMQKKVFKKY